MTISKIATIPYAEFKITSSDLMPKFSDHRYGSLKIVYTNGLGFIEDCLKVSTASIFINSVDHK